MSRLGLSLVELLLLLAIVAFSAGVVWVSWPVPVGAAASRLAASLRSSRAAIVLAPPSDDGHCLEPAIVLAAPAALSWPPRGLLFTPDGLPRTCDGGGVGNTTILLEHRGRQAAVIVSSLGRVRWELR